MATGRWLQNVVKQEEKAIKELHYFFCSDARLKELNEKYLQHYDYTDVITFPYYYNPIEADIYISLERIEENAARYAENDFFLELDRVIVHGLLHMCGYPDSSEREKSTMRKLERSYLKIRP
ncbi:MAG: rRNA maturation RNase YbeY [Saprospiraceae bacterium]|nr:rRNA maturation RNase YbeY [Saprospiraceae bacterium]